MLAITALLHTHNDAMRLGRCLETLYPCDRVVIVDHNSDDATLRIGRDYGAKVISSTTLWGRARAEERSKTPQPRHKSGALEIFMSSEAAPGWIFCLDPRESISESLAASLFELKTQASEDTRPYSIFLREETTEGWLQHPAPQTRLVPHTWNDWDETLPRTDASALVLEGELLRFVLP